MFHARCNEHIQAIRDNNGIPRYKYYTRIIKHGTYMGLYLIQLTLRKHCTE